jgi:hypothetical protein
MNASTDRLEAALEEGARRAQRGKKKREQEERASEPVGWTFGDTATVAALAYALVQRDRSFLAGWALGAVGAAYRAAIWLRRPASSR